MNYYLEQYFNLLINTKKIEDVKMFLPRMILNNTETFVNLLIDKLNKEIEVAKEVKDFEYAKRLSNIIDLISIKKDNSLEISVLKNNVLIFDDEVLKTIRKLNDSLFYQEIKKAIENLESKEWLETNKNNLIKYRRLYGAASGLSEVKTINIRLLHMPINGDFWYVVGILKKDGNRKNGHVNLLAHYKEKAENKISELRNLYTKDGVIDITELEKISNINGNPIKEELNRWGEIKYEK